MESRQTRHLRDGVDSRDTNGTRMERRDAGRLLGLALAAGVAGAAPVAQAAEPATIFQATLAEPNQKTPEVSTAELREILASGSATVFDARPHLEWAISHIPGALNVAPKPGVPTSLYVSDVAEIGRVVPDQRAAVVLYCNGPFCGKSKRLAEELLAAGYADVRRYQLGAPTWRALGGVMGIEPDGLRYVRESDRSAVWYDTRGPEAFAAGSLPGAVALARGEAVVAKDDGRLPMDDHNTRIVVFGRDGEQARTVAEELAANAFHNVTFFGGAFDQLRAVLG
jgi:rhodanese-related sulfurtransferase